MPFDQTTRNRLNRFVGEARTLLSAEFTRQLQHEYGMDPATGNVAALDKLTALNDAQRETARILRTTLGHYVLNAQSEREDLRAEAATWCMRTADYVLDARHGAKLRSLVAPLLERIVREQAFTVLNRLAALRMGEARGLIIESVGRGHRSRGFPSYQQLAGSALGETDDAYRCYLFSLFDELATELPALFDRFSPTGRLFPRPAALLELLALINHPDLEPLWPEDETIGWIYQYFNSQEERRQMRAESQAPRNSRELAVRNQFFTPRYVVEFLTDNTLGRIWYEMTQGATKLVETCRYLVRRPCEVFLRDPSHPLATMPKADWVKAAARGDFSLLPEEPTIEDLGDFSLINYGYDLAARHGIEDAIFWADEQIDHYRATGEWPTSSLELWLILFRQQRYYGRSDRIEASFLAEWRSAYRAFRASIQRTDLPQEELLRQPVYIPFRRLKDPRTILMLDPACGSMHFGLYSFDLFEVIYDEAWDYEEKSGDSTILRPDHLRSLHESYPSKAAFLRDVPRLIVEHNIHGIDIDPRAVQIAGLSLWLRAQKSWQQQKVKPVDRPTISKSNIVCAEPMPGDKAQLEAFLKTLREERLETLIRRVLAVPEHQRVRATPTMADALCDLVRLVWEEMKLAGEAGSLLKIEESLAAAIQKARDEWEQQPLFRVETFHLTEAGAAPARPQVNYTRTVPGEGTDFWGRAEALVLAALAQYAAQAEGDGFARRLFAADAARGFAFIDVCRKRYDVALMNPPFGAIGGAFGQKARFLFGPAAADMYAMFVAMSMALVEGNGLIGALTSRTGFFVTELEDYRRQILSGFRRLLLIADLGYGVLDAAMVETAAYVLSQNQHSESALAIRTLADRNKESALGHVIAELGAHGASSSAFITKPAQLEVIPALPLAYWLPIHLLSAFSLLPSTKDSGITVKQGLGTADDFRFLRLLWEIPYFEIGRPNRWMHFAKGGEYSPICEDIHLVVNWGKQGGEIQNFTDDQGSQKSRPRGAFLYGSPGLTYTMRTTSSYSPRVMPEGCVFSVSGHGIFSDNTAELLTYAGLTYTRVYREILDVCMGGGDVSVAGSAARSYYPTVLHNIPIPKLSDLATVPTKVGEWWNLASSISREDETSALFSKILLHSNGIFESARQIRNRNLMTYVGILEIFGEIDRSVEYGYGLQHEDLLYLDSSQGPRIVDLPDSEEISDAELASLWAKSDEDLASIAADKLGLARFTVKQNYISWRKLELIAVIAGVKPQRVLSALTQRDANLAEVQYLVLSAFSFLVGCSLGRWDIHQATGHIADPILIDPFAPLPACPPSMIKNTAGLPATPGDVPADYPLRISWPGILVDDPGHPEDIVGRMREAMAVIWDGSGQKAVGSGQRVEGSAEAGAALPTANHPPPTPSPTADAIEQEACQILGVPSLRVYFGNPSRFFDDHLKRYSKSRRQAPIYWPLSTPSGAYTLWIYYHRLNDQMLYTCADDFVEVKRKDVGEEIARLRQRKARSRDDERELERLSNLENELLEFRAELLRLAPIWKPNLNDGVQITAAPLWKLFQHRGWQRTLRETWEKLDAGDYDWAHLAMSLWPARVVPKCTTDRSLAIAHDVEYLFWVEDNGRWRALMAPDEEIARQRARQQARLSAAQRGRLQVALRQLAAGSARGIAASVVAQHLAEGDWDDTELALLCWPERVAEKCLDDPALANTLRLNLPPKRTKSAVNRWMAELTAAGCPAEAAALLATLDDDIAFDHLLAALEAGRRDRAPLALPLWPDRVIDRCLENPDLAAAHDLRRFFWVEDESGWRRRREPGVEVAMEIEIR